MSTQMQLRGGTTAENLLFTGAQREVTVDTDKNTLVVHDGTTAGGFPLATENTVSDGTFYFNDDTVNGSVANAYILAPKANTNVPTTYLDGIQLGFVTANANTGPSTATFNGLGVKSLKYRGGIDPAAGDIFGRVYLIYDSTNDWFEIQRKAVAPPPQIRNLTGSVGSNALTAGVPAQTVDFRGTPLTNGNTTSITFTTTLSITAPSGATLGTTSGALSRIVVLALNNAGTVVLGLTNANNSTISFDESELVATTAIGAGSTSANVVYSATGLSNVPYRVIGYIESTQATAGTWASSPTQVQGQGGQNIIGTINRPVLGTPIATTSGVAIDYTSLPANIQRITFMCTGVSLSGGSQLLLQLGTSGGVQSSGYTSYGVRIQSGSFAGSGSTSGIYIPILGAAEVHSGLVEIVRQNGNIWVANGSLSSANYVVQFSGGVSLGGDLNRIRLASLNGTDTFDAGSVNIFYEF